MTSSRRVLLPEPLQSEAVDMLEKAACEVVHAPDPSPETVIPLLRGTHGMVLRTGLKVTRDLLSHADQLKVISRTGAGYDNVDVAAATEKGIVVTSNLGVNTVSVVEHVLSLMLALSKHLPLMDREVRRGNFAVRRRNLPRDLFGKTLGVLGFGRIGIELARVCRQGLGMKTLAYDPFVSEEVMKDNGAAPVDLRTLLRESDVLSIHVPLSDRTRHLLGEEELSWMKPGALLINAARGGVVDEEALARALREGRPAGAGIDVFSQEPPQDDSPLLAIEHVILTPHSAALTAECVVRMATEAAHCVIDLLEGFQPPNIANPEVLDLERWKHLEPPKGIGR